MNDNSKTKQQLIKELIALRRRVGQLEELEASRQQSDDALRKSEANYRQLFENSPAGIYQVDFKSGKFLRVNDVFRGYLGYSDEEITSLHSYDILTEESKKLFWERMKKMALGEEVPETVEYEIVDKNGKQRWVHLNNKMIYDAEGHVVASDVVAHEITERKKMEKALKESDERFKALFDGSLDGVFIHDFEGNIFEINQAAIDKLGYDRNEIRSLNFAALLDEEQSLQAIQYIDELIRTGLQQIPAEYKVKCKDGSHLDIENKSSVVYRDGKPYAILGISRDITDRKQAEEERERLISELQQSLSEVKTLSGLLPICPSCKKIRDDKGYWNQLESYIKHHSQAEFSHAICPECAKRLYPEFYKEK